MRRDRRGISAMADASLFMVLVLVASGALAGAVARSGGDAVLDERRAWMAAYVKEMLPAVLYSVIPFAEENISGAGMVLANATAEDVLLMALNISGTTGRIPGGLVEPVRARLALAAGGHGYEFTAYLAPARIVLAPGRPGGGDIFAARATALNLDGTAAEFGLRIW